MDKGLGKESIKLYWRFNKPYRKYLYGSLIMLPMTVVLSVQVLSYIVSEVVNKLSIGIMTDFSGFQPYLMALIGLSVLAILLSRLNMFFIWRHEDYTVRDMAVACFNNLSLQSSAFHADNFGGALVTKVAQFTHGYVRLYDSAMWNLYTLICSVIFSTILLWLSVPIVAVIVLLGALLYCWLVVTKYHQQMPLNVKLAQSQSKRTGYIADVITNIMAVKAYSRENYEADEFKKLADKVTKNSQNLMWNVQKKEFLLSPINAVASVLAITLAVLSVTYWQQPVGTVVLVLALSTDILRRVNDLNHFMRNLTASLGDAHDMTGILLAEQEVKDTSDPKDLAVTEGAVEFKDVTFRHADSRGEHLFTNLNLNIAGGERIGLVGPSGGGKTTITKLLLRFFDAEAGTILIDDQDISKIRQQDLRQHIAYVPQEPLLFHRSLSENISYGRPGASQTEIESAARLANAHEFIQKLPGKYATKVGERGVKLSGGQRQRVAIARAILKDSLIIVLDEATSSLDSSSEKLIQAALWELMKGRTALVIAHRLSTVQRMDRIIVLDEGKIKEQGTHEKLLKQHGIYSELWQHQSGGFIK
jgi:ATP-binding cassette subfamily B protein